jgi:hypothetical protein
MSSLRRWLIPTLAPILGVGAVCRVALADVCSMEASGKNYEDIPEQVAKSSVVFVKAATSCPGGAPGSFVSMGMGFAVSASTVKEGTWVVVVTATHIVTDLANQDLPWACRVVVQAPGGPMEYEATRDKRDIGPSELERSTDVTVLRVLFPVTSTTDFGWPGWGDSRALENGARLSFGRHKADFDLEFEQATATGSFTRLRAAARGDIQCGDSGTPVFDKNWQIVGMLANEKENAKDGGFFVTSEVIELTLRGEGIETNLPTTDVAQRKFRDDEWSHTKGGLLFGYARIQDKVVPNNALGLVRFGGYIEGHLTTFKWPLVNMRSGVRIVGSYDLLGGYQSDRHGYIEVVTSAGISLFQRFGALDSAGFARWAPSIFHWETIANPEIILTGFSAGYRLTGESWGGGLELRWVSHSGRSDFVPSVFVTW